MLISICTLLRVRKEVSLSLYLEVEGFVNLTETALAEQHQKQVPIVEDGVIVESALVLVVNPFQFANVQVTFPFQLFHFELQVAVLFLQSVLLQLFGAKPLEFIVPTELRKCVPCLL